RDPPPRSPLFPYTTLFRSDRESAEMNRAVTRTPSASVDLLALAECVEKFSSKTVVLLGDFVADEFQFGEISRVSREAPVLILRQDRKSTRLNSSHRTISYA